MIKADLHIHTCYSADCLTPLERIVERCVEQGINCIAVADHNTIVGAMRLREIAPFKVIVAEEILTVVGEVMGLFLTKTIPHPFGRSLPWHRNVLASAEILSQVDIIEAFNSRTPFSSSIRRAAALAKQQGKAASAGSDAHTVREIGRAYVKMPEFDGPDDFLNSLAQGQIFGQKSSYVAHFASMWAKMRKRLFGDPSRSLP